MVKSNNNKMSKLKDTLLMMAAEKENFKIEDKTFQIIEVVEAEQPQPDYSHLVGKWVKFILDMEYAGVKRGSWHQVDHIGSKKFPIVIAGEGSLGSRSWTQESFDLTNPQDSNPDEVKKILVPKEIVISEDVDGLNLHFGNNQALYVYHGSDSYGVLSEVYRKPIQCELIKCERAELKKGDLAFRKGNEDIDLLNHSLYCVIISDIEHCFIGDNRSVFISDDTFNHWYKLQPIEQ